LHQFLTGQQWYHLSCYGWQDDKLQKQINQVKKMAALERIGG
jgi:hypothetical protein